MAAGLNDFDKKLREDLEKVRGSDTGNLQLTSVTIENLVTVANAYPTILQEFKTAREKAQSQAVLVSEFSELIQKFHNLLNEKEFPPAFLSALQVPFLGEEDEVFDALQNIRESVEVFRSRLAKTVKSSIKGKNVPGRPPGRNIERLAKVAVIAAAKKAFEQNDYPTAETKGSLYIKTIEKIFNFLPQDGISQKTGPINSATEARKLLRKIATQGGDN